MSYLASMIFGLSSERTTKGTLQSSHRFSFCGRIAGRWTLPSLISLKIYERLHLGQTLAWTCGMRPTAGSWAFLQLDASEEWKPSRDRQEKTRKEPRKACTSSRASACLIVRGNPSIIKPERYCGCLRTSMIFGIITSSGINSPRRTYFYLSGKTIRATSAIKPKSVPCCISFWIIYFERKEGIYPIERVCNPN